VRVTVDNERNSGVKGNVDRFLFTPLKSNDVIPDARQVADPPKFLTLWRIEPTPLKFLD
jgi:hypothetical protein